MENIRNFAYQPSKITQNVRYDYSEECYQMEKGPNIGTMIRRVSDFFGDAHLFVGLFTHEYPFEKIFFLDFADESSLEKAMSKFLNKGFNEEEHLTVEIEEEINRYRLHVFVYEGFAFDFIFGKGTDMSIRRLSKLLKMKFEFSYVLRSEQPIECRGVADCGNVEVDFSMNYHSLNDLDGIRQYMLEFSAFIDIVPTYDALRIIRPKLSLID